MREYPVINHHALHAHYLLGGVGYGHHVALWVSSTVALVYEGGARLQGEVLVVDLRGEVRRVYVRRVSLLGCLLRRPGGTICFPQGGAY